MSDRQLSFFDAPAARQYQRKQKDAERDALLIQYLGPKGAKRWHAKEDKLRAQLDEISKIPYTPEMQEAIARMQARVAASTKPLVNEYTLLGIEPGSVTKRDVKNAYRRQARKLHPDVGGDDETFKHMYAAYRRVLASVKE